MATDAIIVTAITWGKITGSKTVNKFLRDSGKTKKAEIKIPWIKKVKTALALGLNELFRFKRCCWVSSATARAITDNRQNKNQVIIYAL